MTREEFRNKYNSLLKEFYKRYYETDRIGTFLDQLEFIES